MHTLRSGVAIAIAVLVAVVTMPLPASADCSFDVNGDGEADLELRDDDGDGECEWPTGTTNLPGTLTFTAATPVEFSGVTAVIADRIVVENGGLLFADSQALRKLVLTARGGGDIVSEGTLDLAAEDDVILQARGSLHLGGDTRISAGDRVTLKATAGNAVIAPPTFSPAGPFTLFARNRIDVEAKGANGSVDIARARLGAYRINVRTRALVSVVGPKQLTLRDHTVLTTDRSATGLLNQSSIFLDATGRIIVTGDVRIDAGTNVTFATSRQIDDVCLSNNTSIEAGNGVGAIYLSRVRGMVFDDGTTSFVGRLIGSDRLVVGACPGAPETTTTTSPTASTTSSTTTGPTTTSTLPPDGLTPALWEFYVRIARTDGSETNVLVPKASSDPAVAASIRSDHIPAFPLGDQVTGAEIAALGGDTLARLTAAAQAYIQAHPEDYPSFSHIVTLNWAKRVG